MHQLAAGLDVVEAPLVQTRCLVGILAALALFAGVVIYLVGRTETLVVFSWLRVLGLGSFVAALRVGTESVSVHLPDFVRYSVPDGLWVLSFSLAIQFVWWGYRLRGRALAWHTFPVLLGVGSEIGQMIGWVHGTFDLCDVVAYASGSLFVAVLWRCNQRRDWL